MRSRFVVLALLAGCHPAPPLATPSASAASPSAAATPAPPSAPPTPSIDLDKLLATQTRGLYACLEREAALRPDFGGHLDAAVDVDTTGRVVDVQISASTFPDDSALPCLLRAWRDLRLPRQHDHTRGRMRLAWEPSSDGCRSAVPGVGASLEKEEIRRIIQSHLDEVRFCYEKQLVHNLSLQGRVMVQFTISPDGTVGDAIVQDSTVDDVEVGSCIVGATRGWRFPQPCGGGRVIVSYPFVLKSADAAP